MNTTSNKPRRQFLIGAGCAALSSRLFGQTPPSTRHSQYAAPEEPPVDLGRSRVERILDAAIDCIAESGCARLTPGQIALRSGVSESEVAQLHARKKEFVTLLTKRLFARRIRVYLANAALLDGQTETPLPGLTSLAKQFPDPIWIAYWDILFAYRHDAELLGCIQAVTNDYDSQFEVILHRFFPPGIPAATVNFVLVHFDGLGLLELTHAGRVPRADQLARLAEILDSNERASIPVESKW